MERLRHLLPDFATLRQSVDAYPVEDPAIREQIAKDYERYGDIWCPHTATAFWVYDQLPRAIREREPWIVAATAHPAKFDNIVEDVIGTAVPVPPALAALLALPAETEPLKADSAALAEALKAW
jgi:threonine synthase